MGLHDQTLFKDIQRHGKTSFARKLEKRWNLGALYTISDTVMHTAYYTKEGKSYNLKAKTD